VPTVSSLEEIESHWSICDLVDAHEAMDIRHEVEAKQAEEVRIKH